MSAYIKLYDFVAFGQRAYNAPEVQHLVLDEGDRLGLCLGKHRRLQLAEIQQQNRRTWRVFARCLRDVIGESKVQKICSRFHFNIQKMEKEGLPLLAKHIELFSIGASRVMTHDIKRRSPQQRLRDLSVLQIQKRMRISNPIPILGWSLDPLKIPGTPTTFLSWFLYNPLLMDKETQLLLSDVADLSSSEWKERACKCIINRELEEKQIIPAPGENGNVEYYKVYRRIACKGLFAYALKPIGSDSTLKPFLIFRPSQLALSNEDAIDTYLNDLETNIGRMGYMAARSSLNLLMNDPKFCPANKKIEVGGYSLGGTQAQRFIAEHWRKVFSATFYNDPSLEGELAQRFAQEVNNSPRFVGPLRLNIFRTTGDIAHYVGEKHLGWGLRHSDVSVQLLEFDHQNQKISLPDLHAQRVFDSSCRDYHVTVHNPDELDAYLDNEHRGPAVFWYEKMRRYWGPTVFWLLLGLREVIKFFSALSGIQILRSSKRTY